jgi:hypothetical protein
VVRQVSGHDDDVAGRVDAPLVEPSLVAIMRNICADTDTADSALDHRLCRATGIICAYSFAQDALLVAPNLPHSCQSQRSVSLAKRSVEPQHHFVSNWIHDG